MRKYLTYVLEIESMSLHKLKEQLSPAFVVRVLKSTR